MLFMGAMMLVICIVGSTADQRRAAHDRIRPWRWLLWGVAGLIFGALFWPWR
jgi:hypothetical protein